jgi:hypothetical protein
MAREEEGFFDELARGLADGTLTRGKALRLMGAALVGGSLASLGIREAAADRPGCKRNGKNCTRDTQCCGSLVCPSGTCQTPTTSTTETPTTSTTETPTTTTTETPSTTTSTPCLPNGGSCTTNGQCCSDNCSNGFCCPTGYVGLSNGTCAKPCSTAAECSCTCIGRFPSSSEGLCGTSSLGDPCATDASCPPGEFCRGLPGSDPLSGVCTPAC